MNLQVDLVVDGRTVGLVVTLLFVWGMLYDLGLAWAYKNLPPAQIMLYHLIASCFGIGLAVLLTIPLISLQSALLVIAALAIAGLPIAGGMLFRYFRPFTRVPSLTTRLHGSHTDTEHDNG